MRTFEIIGDESMKELAEKVSILERFDDKLAAWYTILTHLELKYGGCYIFEIAYIKDEYLFPERDNTTYGDNSAFPGLYPPLKSFMFYLNKNDKDVYDSIKRTCKRIDKKNRKKQNLKTYGFIAFIIFAFILLFNLI